MFSPVFKQVNASLLGQSMDGVPPESMVFNESMMHDFNMGYYEPKKRTPHSSVAYFESENKFYHPWSIASSGKTYGYGKLKDLLPLRDYMEMPAAVVDELLEAVVEAEKERYKLDNPPESDPKKDGMSKDLIDLMKQLGFDRTT